MHQVHHLHRQLSPSPATHLAGPASAPAGNESAGRSVFRSEGSGSALRVLQDIQQVGSGYFSIGLSALGGLIGAVLLRSYLTDPQAGRFSGDDEERGDEVSGSPLGRSLLRSAAASPWPPTVD